MPLLRFQLGALLLVLAGALLPGGAPAEARRLAPRDDRFHGWTPLSGYVSAGLAEGGSFRLTVPTRAGEIELDLRPVEVHGAAYRAETAAIGGQRTGRRRAEVRTFAGAVRKNGGAAAARSGRGGDFARLALEPSGRITGLLRVDGVLYDLAADAAAGDLLLQVEETDLDALREAFGACAATVDEALAGLAADEEAAAPLAAAGAGAVTLREVELGTEADALFVAQTGGVDAANARIASMINAINGIYEFDLGLTNRIVFQRAWEGDDPYTTTNSDPLLREFTSEFGADVATPTDVAVLFSGRDFENNVVGRAWLRAACSDLRFGVNQYYQQSDSITRMIVAHEMGHNLGSNHTADGIMAPGINADVTWFSASSQNQIEGYVASASCLAQVETGGPPEIQPIGPQSVTEGELLELELEAIDPDGDPVSWAALPLPVGASLTSGGTFRWRPAQDSVGCNAFEDLSITFYARDPDGNIATETVVISVIDAATGAAPRIDNPADRAAPAGRALVIPLSARDPDGDNIAFSAVGLPAGAALSAPGVLSWTPSEAQRGPHVIDFAVTDCTGAVATEDLAIEVVSGAPHLTSVSSATGSKGDELTLTGQNLLGRKLRVYFGAKRAKAFGLTDTSVTVRVPNQKKDTPAAVEIRVLRDGIASDNALPFTYVVCRHPSAAHAKSCSW
jgi:hypothetical protein